MKTEQAGARNTQSRLMQPRILICLGSVCWFTACSTAGRLSTEQGAQEGGAHFLEKSIALGARPISTNNLPALRIKATEKSDGNGFSMRTRRENYRPVLNFLEAAFGRPGLGPYKTTEGKMSIYKAADVGVAIQVGTDKKGAFVNVIRGMSWQELRGPLYQVR